MDMEPVAQLTGETGQVWAHSGDRHGYVRVLDGPRVEKRCHQREPVELPFVGEPCLVLPRLPDGAQGEDVIPQPRAGAEPLGREASGDVGLDLRAQPEDETATRRPSEVPGRHG